MKVKLEGKVTCKKCQWSGLPKDLREEHNGLLVKCPNCSEVLMDFTNGNFIIQNLKAEKLTM